MHRCTPTVVALATFAVHCAVSGPAADSPRFQIDGDPVYGSFAVTWQADELRDALETGINLVYCYDLKASAQLLDPATELGSIVQAHKAKVMANLCSGAGGKHLVEDIDASATAIQLNFRGGREGPGTFWLGDEAVRFETCAAGRLEGCTRGWAGTEAGAHARGLYVVHEEPLRDEVLKIKDSPNLWGYWTMDDKKGNQRDALRNVYRVIKQHDRGGDGTPNPHVVVAGMPNEDALSNFDAGVCDLAGIYIYPSRRGAYDTALAPQTLKRMLPLMEQRAPGTPFMGIYQAFTGEKYTPKPTRVQVRKQIQDFAHFGASAFMAYSWRMVRDFGTLRNLPDLREEVRLIGTDLRSGRMQLDRARPSHPERPEAVPELSQLTTVATFGGEAVSRCSGGPGVTFEHDSGPGGGDWLHLRFEAYTGGEAPQWPSVRLGAPGVIRLTDWSSAGWLVAVVHNPMAEESEIGLTVRDVRGTPWWARYFPLPAGKTTPVYADLQTVRRLVDVSGVDVCTLLMRRPDVATHLLVRGLYLAPVQFARVEGVALECAPFDDAPTLDGDLADACWRDVPVANLLDEQLNLPPLQPVTVRVGRRGATLYLAVESTVRHPEDLCISEQAAAAWEAVDDTIEVFLRNPLTGDALKHVVSAGGRTKTYRLGLNRQTAVDGIRTGSAVRDSVWTVETEIGAQALGAGQAGGMELNVRRRDRQLGPLIWAKGDRLPPGLEPMGVLRLR